MIGECGGVKVLFAAVPSAVEGVPVGSAIDSKSGYLHVAIPRSPRPRP